MSAARLSKRPGTTLPRSPSIFGGGGEERAGAASVSLAPIGGCPVGTAAPAIGALDGGASGIGPDMPDPAACGDTRLGPCASLPGRPAGAVPKAGSLLASPLLSSIGRARGKSQSGVLMSDGVAALAAGVDAEDAIGFAGAIGGDGTIGVVTTSLDGAAMARNSSRLTASSAAGARGTGPETGLLADDVEAAAAVDDWGAGAGAAGWAGSRTAVSRGASRDGRRISALGAPSTPFVGGLTAAGAPDGGSWAMILRIDARISLMLRASVLSGLLDIRTTSTACRFGR